ncbi:hypothetical protein BKA64DRAFT_649366 [Cadophora sp. MPI-SDFR-AT-0126]|nr:hypothetical protein BKA64DRAFT_649366 [Leotiomycetes sp. MPI-SDFR-AT-0126]
MPLDLQLDGATLRNLVRGYAQEKLSTTCVPPLLGTYLDHVTISDVTMIVSPNQTEFHLLANIFQTTDAELQANVNQAPPGALTGADRTTITILLTVNQTTLELNLQSTVPGLEDLNPIGTFDLSPIFGPTGLGLPAPTSATFESVQDTLIVRFDPDGEAVNHLQPGQIWGFFISSTSIAIIANTLLETYHIKEQLPGSVTIGTGWAPRGPVPHVNISINGIHQDLGIGGSVDVGLSVGLDLQLDPQRAAVGDGLLQQIVTWYEPSLDTHGVAEWGEDIVRGKVDEILESALDPKKLGAIPIGPRSFMREQHLPKLAFGSTKFSYRFITAYQDGMVIGGNVYSTPKVQTFPLGLDVRPFPKDFTKTISCRAHGSGPHLGIHVSASAYISNAGKLCSWDVLSPNGVEPYITVSPDPGQVTDSVSISSTLSMEASQQLSGLENVRIRIRTANGVRLVNLGTPPAKLDENGQPTKVNIEKVDDCVHSVEIDPWKLRFGIFNPHWLPYPPPIIENLGRVAAFQSSLVTVNVIEPGEVVTFNQPITGLGPAVFLPNNTTSRVFVPTVLAVRSFDEGANLQKIGHSGFGEVTLDTKHFSCVATLTKPGAISNRISSRSNADRVTVIHQFADRLEATQVDPQGLIFEASVEESDRAEAGAHLEVETALTKSWKLSGRKILALHPIPGFEGASTVVVELEDGSICSLFRDDKGEVSVSGVLPNWPKGPRTSGKWAISEGTGDRVFVFTVADVKGQKISGAGGAK